MRFAMAAASTLPGWLAAPLLAHAQVPIRRYDVNSEHAEARAAVQKFREAVRALKERRPHDPASWIWQANMHGWPGQFGGNPDAEFGRVFPAKIPGISPPDRLKLIALARTTWGQCPHGPPQFLPWHRVYVYCFERILQKAVNDDTLGVPYWDWTKDLTLPAAFREPVSGSQQKNPLFYSPRNPGVSGNSKGEMPLRLTEVEVSVRDMLSSRTLDARLKPDGTGNSGFGPQVETGPHGNVHVFVGDDRGMGFFEFAARDPVFWAHHANIDRLWESWAMANEMPMSATSWLSDKHTFISPQGQALSLTTREVLVASAILGGGYEYERRSEVPIMAVGPAPAVAPSGAVAATAATVAASAGRVKLSNARTSVRLIAAPPTVGGTPANLPSSTYKLVLKDLSVERSPRDNYGVYLNASPNAVLTPESPHYAGPLNFFSAARPIGAGHHTQQQHAGTTVEINATETLRRLQQAQLWNGGDVTVTLVPLRGRIDPLARPSVGAIELLRN